MKAASIGCPDEASTHWYEGVEDMVTSLPFLKFSLVRSAATTLLRKMCCSREKIEALWVECETFAKAEGVDPRTIFLAQYSYDLSQMAETQMPTACTVGAYKDNFVRFLDWGVPEGLGRYTETQDRTYGAKSHKAIGFPGFFGTVTAAAPELCFAMNQMPCAKIDKAGLPSAYWARLVYERVLRLQHGDSDMMPSAVTKVLRDLAYEGVRPMSSMALTFANGQDTVTVSIHPGMEPEMDGTEGVFVLANRFRTKKHKGHNDLLEDDCIEFSADRERQMRTCLRKMDKQDDPEKATEVAFSMGYPVLNEATANVTVYSFATRELVVRPYG